MLYVVIVQVVRTLVRDVIDIFTFHVDILMVKRDMKLLCGVQHAKLD